MADATADFFDGLATRGTEPLLGTTRATVRFDIVDGDRTRQWVVRIRDGAIDVQPGDGKADCVLRAEKAAFDQVAGGTMNAMAATLRGAIVLEGEPRLLVRVQRLFPPPIGMPATAGERSVGRRRS